MADTDSPDNQAGQHPEGGLEVALRALHRPPFAVPPEIDARVLADARRVLGHPAHRFSIRPSLLAAAALLALTAAVPIYLWTRNRTVSPPVSRAALAGDLDADGRVDIVDAMVLAAGIARHDTGPAVRDINGDGVIDGSDVDALALLAVRLDGGGT